MQTALKAVAAIQAIYSPANLSMKNAMATKTNFFQKSTILSSAEDDAFAFAMIDADQNGLMTAAELSAFLTAFGEPNTIGECQMAIDSVDKNRDGALNFGEFRAANNQSLVEKKPVQLWSSEDEQIFVQGDTNKDGYLSLTEYKNLIVAMDPSLAAFVTEDWIWAQTQQCDWNGDRKFSRDELDNCN